MKLSTRSRYGIRLMYDLALNYGKGYVFLKDISEKQDVSEKYLGQLIIPLRGANLVKSSRGAHGGYALTREPSQITLYDIVNVLEGSSCVVDCARDPKICPRYEKCPTRPVWERLDNTISSFLEEITLETIIDEEIKKTGKQGTYQI